MNDYGIYWKNFAKESRQEDWPCTFWMTNSDRLAHCEGGDRLWLFTSGAKCDQISEKAGYLVEILTVESVSDNRGGDSEYPPDDFRFKILGDKARCLAISPPLFVDDLLREEGQDSQRGIGTFLQSPRRLRPEILTALIERLRAEHSNLCEQLALPGA